MFKIKEKYYSPVSSVTSMFFNFYNVYMYIIYVYTFYFIFYSILTLEPVLLNTTSWELVE